MTPEQWNRVKEIFGDALEREPSDRESFIREAAKDDADLLAELLRLLKENERDSDLLSQLAVADTRAIRPEEPPRFAASTLLARRFRIVRFIARGGMGEVYEAEDLELGERVALKAIRPRVASDPELRALFKREVQLARRVTHPNVCRIFDLHENPPEDGEPVLLLSMELIEGQTLAHHLRQNGPMSFDDMLLIIEQIGAGLQAVHDAGVIHGDLKPGNVMLALRPGETIPQARVMDFGVALPAGASGLKYLDKANLPLSDEASSSAARSIPVSRQSSPPLRGGTPDYLAPEQVKGAAATTATDIYAFALVIGDMLGIPREKRLAPDADRMPSRWVRILRRCLEEDPARRYSRPTDLSIALRGARSGWPRARWIAVATAAVTLLGILIAARRFDLGRGTANRLVLTESRAESVQNISPDGNYLADTSWDTGDLILHNVGSGKTKRLTHKKTPWDQQYGGAYGALFSRDGRQIAYVWMNGRSDAEVRIIGTDGKNERTLYHSPSTNLNLVDWSADGNRILTQVLDHGGRPQQLAFLFPRDGSLQLLQSPPAAAQTLFGADGQGLIFDVRGRPGAGVEIHGLSSAGVESTLVGRTGSNSIVGWSPDRRRLIFLSDRRGQPGIWAVPISDRGAEGEPQELVPDAKGWEPLGITRSGALFYRQNSDLIDVYTAVVDLAAGRIVLPPRRVTERFIGTYAYPNWSEDGQKLVFDSNRDRPMAGLAIFEPQTDQLRELRIDLTRAWRPQWVEHGAAIMLPARGRDGRDGQFRIDPRTGAATMALSSQDLDSHFEGIWSRDGKIHFNRYDDFRRGIFRLNVETGERRVLYVPPPGVDVGTENLALSPDGLTLAFHARKNDGTGTLMLMSPEGGEARPLLTVKIPQSFWYGSFTWTPDSRKILAVITNQGHTPNEELVSEIWQVPVDGNAPTKIDFPPLWITSLRLNPDGKTLAFQVRHWRSEIWVLQNFL